MYTKSRRKFLKKTLLACSAFPFIHTSQLWEENKSNPLSIHIFSKQLQFLSYEELGEKAAEIGFDGVDLTVRPKGHVLPEFVERDLPQAIAKIKAGGSRCQLITTGVSDSGKERDMAVLKAVAAQGIKYYRSAYYRFSEKESMQETLAACKSKVAKLSQLNQKLGIIGAYQNHAGLGVGSEIWEIAQMLPPEKTAHFGIQYDIRHAMVEGGLSWKNGLRLIKDQIKTIVLKDFKWEKVKGKWRVVNTPIGEGMVDFPTYFRLLKQYKIHVPVSLHLEYPLGGAEHGAKELSSSPEIVYEAMKKDLAKIRAFWEDA
ncbi:MAG: sugar phosphate isomerase/epimerase family protein [Bacteroidota bacterium]